jgi:hypothetical protein
MTELDVYLWTRMDGIHNTFNFIAVCSGLLLGFGVSLLLISEDERPKTFTKWIAVVFGLNAFLCVVVPDSKDYAMIKVIPRLVNSKAIQVDAPELYDIAIKALKEKINSEIKK